jgi:hypothetical protein
MIKDYSKLFNREALEEILVQYREKILKEIDSAKDLMALLMKGTRGKWTKGELFKIKAHFVTLGKKVPILMVFMLPGGIILLPLLIEVLDRRKKKVPVQKDRRKSPNNSEKKTLKVVQSRC